MISDSNKSTAEETAREPDIYQYHDYRLYLKDWFEYLRKVDRNFSLRSLSKKAGLSSGYLPTFLAGTIGLSTNALGKIIPYLGLSTSKRSYLKLLRTISESENPEERVEMLKKLQRFREYQKLNGGEIETYRYMSHWYYVAIREMAGLPDFRLDPKWIQEKLRFKVSLKEIEDALDFLMKHQYIGADPEGISGEQSEKQIDCVGGVYRLVLSKFHREMLGLAQESIEKTPRKERGIIAHTLPLNVNRFDQVKEILNEALEKIKKLGEEEARPDSVYHVEFSVFPLTMSDKEKGKKRRVSGDDEGGR